MTKEEAIAILKQPDRIGCNLINANDEESCKFNQESIEALNMAIKALEQQPSEDCVSRKAILDTITEIDDNINMDIYTNEVREIIRELPPVTPKLPTSEDCVSRRAVLDIIHEYKNNIDSQLSWLSDGVCDLPPVTPTFPKGATNGDMIKAMFPDIKIDPNAKNSDWWNAPYKGVNDGSN